MINRPDRIELYKTDGGGLVAALESSVTLREGDYVNVRRITYRVTFVSFAIDDADDRHECRMRQNVNLEEVKDNE